MFDAGDNSLASLGIGGVNLTESTWVVALKRLCCGAKLVYHKIRLTQIYFCRFIAFCFVPLRTVRLKDSRPHATLNRL